MKKIIARAVLAGVLAAAGPYAAAASFTIGPGGIGTTGNLSLPFSVNYSDSFSQNGSFTDDYTFTFSPDASLNTFAASIDVQGFSGVSGLKLAVFQGGSPVGGSPVGGQWTFGQMQGAVDIVQLTGLALTANTYTLEIKGVANVAGTPASYQGQFALAPVPEPETYALMLAGLGMLGWVGARRRKNA